MTVVLVPPNDFSKQTPNLFAEDDAKSIGPKLENFFKQVFSVSTSAQVLTSLRSKKVKILESMSFFSVFFHRIGWKKNTDLTSVEDSLKKTEIFIKRNRQKIGHYLSFFTKKDKKFFKILAKMQKVAPEINLKDQEKEFFKTYLKEIGKRKKTYDQLLTIYEDEFLSKPTLERLDLNDNSLSIFEDLMRYSSKMKQKQYSKLYLKAHSLLNKIENREEITKKEKLTKKEFASLDRLPPDLWRIEFVKKFGLLGEVEEELQSIRKLRILRNQIQQNYIDKMQIPSGSILLQDIFDQKSITNNKKINLVDRVVLLSTHSRYAHAGMLIRHPLKCTITQSHVLRSHVDEELDFFDFVTGRCITFDWKQCISSRDQKKLQKIYGENWEEKIQDLYEKVSENFYGREYFESIHNSPMRQFLSVFKLPFTLTKNIPEKTLFNGQTLFCSEFVARSLFCCFDRLNKELAKDLEERGCTVSREIVRSPFGSRTRFSTVHPGNLVKRLKPYVKPVQFSSLEKIVDQDS